MELDHFQDAAVLYSLRAFDGSMPSSVTLHWINTGVSHLSL